VVLIKNFDLLACPVVFTVVEAAEGDGRPDSLGVCICATGPPYLA